MKVCPFCSKTSRVGGKRNLLRGKYNPTKPTRKHPNLQWARLPQGGRTLACASCIKHGAHLKTK